MVHAAPAHAHGDRRRLPLRLEPPTGSRGEAPRALPALAASGRSPRLSSGGTYEQIIVPSGATCRLLGVRVAENVEVARNATLITDEWTRVGGNIQAEEPVSLRVRRTAGPVGGPNRAVRKEDQCARL